MISGQLWAAYCATRYIVHTNTDEGFQHKEFSIRHAVQNRELGSFMERVEVDTAAIVTAYNPYSRTVSGEQNRASHQVLEKLLVSEGYQYSYTDTLADDGRWPSEPGFCIWAIERSDADAIAREFEQNAFIWIERGKGCVVGTSL